jgi:hypothetical protein
MEEGGSSIFVIAIRAIAWTELRSTTVRTVSGPTEIRNGTTSRNQFYSATAILSCSVSRSHKPTKPRYLQCISQKEQLTWILFLDNGRLILSLCLLTKHHAVKAYWGSGDIALPIL